MGNNTIDVGGFNSRHAAANSGARNEIGGQSGTNIFSNFFCRTIFSVAQTALACEPLLLTRDIV
ncbi:MAG TPA: hypothetical protein VIY07_04950, partial [Pseudolabrys sp.]